RSGSSRQRTTCEKNHLAVLGFSKVAKPLDGAVTSSTGSVHACLHLPLESRTVAPTATGPQPDVVSLLLAAFQLSSQLGVFAAHASKACGPFRQLHAVLGHRRRRKGGQDDRGSDGMY